MMWLLLLLLIEATSSVLGKCRIEKKEPVCADDGVTYANRCLYDKARELNPDLELAHRGACKCDPKYLEWDPICSSEGQSYGTLCEYERMTGHREHITLAYRDLCKEFVEKKVMTGADYQKIYLWKKIMPHELYDQLMSREISLQNGGTVPSPYMRHKIEQSKKNTKKKPKKKPKNKKQKNRKKSKKRRKKNGDQHAEEYHNSLFKK